MSNRITQDAIFIRKRVREAEAVTDEAMIACAKLKQALLKARQNPAIGVDAGQRAILRLAQAEQQAVAMSTNLLRVHEELNRVAREYMGGDDPVETPMTAFDLEAPTASAARAQPDSFAFDAIGAAAAA
ncbi:hypothetical protein PF049_13210 [Erythrobacteraceae bacterium WH01K]|nr:hypothetical protein PF049_13210 [Erythrobacteraceae bacterium WH01K]